MVLRNRMRPIWSVVEDDGEGSSDDAETEAEAEAEGTEEDAPASDDLSALIAKVDSLAETSEKILGFVSGLKDSLAGFVENGGTVQEGAATGDADETPDDIDLDTPIEDMDFSLDEDED